MQLVRTFSATLRSDPDTARRQLLPCPLSVTPVGASMGLIQWVDHTMPLYGVYKAWQHRQLTDKAGKLLLGVQYLSQHTCGRLVGRPYRDAPDRLLCIDKACLART